MTKQTAWHVTTGCTNEIAAVGRLRRRRLGQAGTTSCTILRSQGASPGQQEKREESCFHSQRRAPCAAPPPHAMSDLAHDAPQPSSQEALVGAAAQLREEYAELLLASGLSARGVGATGAAVAAAEVRPTHTCHFSVSHLAMREAAAQDWVEEHARRSANTFARPVCKRTRLGFPPRRPCERSRCRPAPSVRTGRLGLLIIVMREGQGWVCSGSARGARGARGARTKKYKLRRRCPPSPARVGRRKRHAPGSELHATSNGHHACLE